MKAEARKRDGGRWMFWALVLIGLAVIVGLVVINASNTVNCIFAGIDYETAVWREKRELTHANIQAAALASLEVERWCGAQRLAEIDAELDAQP